MLPAKQASFNPATPLQTCMAVSKSLLIISLHSWGAVSCAHTVQIQLAGDTLKHRMADATNAAQELHCMHTSATPVCKV